jgi:hypothetical protein
VRRFKIKERRWIRGVGEGCSLKGEKILLIPKEKKRVLREEKKEQVTNFKYNFAWCSR